jgi:eukaryotic-like serine/threonine-protein kinase
VDDRAIGIGTVLNGTYRLEQVLGEGGMGRVYRAQHLRVPRQFAIKMLVPELAPSAAVLERFRREADIASALGSEHIVHVFDFDRTPDGTAYMVLELLEGEDLGQRLMRGRLSLQATADLLRQVSSALELAHARGIVHRDLKPANLFLCTNGLLKIMDFGISKVLHTETLATTPGLILGTPNYMSPEQAEGRIDEIDARTDLFALGAILYECLSGRVAFHGDTGINTLFAICHREPPPLAALAPDVPESVIAVIRRALAKDRAARFASVAELYTAFVAAVAFPERAASTVLMPAPHAGAPRLLTPTTLGSAASQLQGERRPSRRSGAVAALLATLALAGGAWWWTTTGVPDAAPVPEAVEVPPPPVVVIAPPPVVVDAASPPVVDATPPPSVDAPPPVAEPVMLTLRLRPRRAKALLDGRAIDGDHVELPADGAAHELVVRAPGYRSHREIVIVGASRTLEISLEPEPARREKKPLIEVEWQ